MKPLNYYSKQQTAYPFSKDYTTFYVYDKGVCLDEVKPCPGTNQITKSDLSRKYPNAVIQEVFDKDAYNKHRKEYSDEKTKLYLEFQNDLFEKYGVNDNPKRFQCFELAWGHGHASGLSEVDGYFGDLVVLIQDN